MPKIVFVEHETCELINEVEQAAIPTLDTEIMVTDIDSGQASYRSVLHVVPHASHLEVRLGRSWETPAELSELNCEQRVAVKNLARDLVYPDLRTPYEFGDLMVYTLESALFLAWRMSLLGGGRSIRTEVVESAVDKVGAAIRRHRVAEKGVSL